MTFFYSGETVDEPADHGIWGTVSLFSDKTSVNHLDTKANECSNLAF